MYFENLLKVPKKFISYFKNSLIFKLQNSFTLIELIVVIVIIGILAALSVPQYNKAVDEAHKKEAFSNLNVISAAELGYLYENNIFYAINTLTDTERNDLGIDIYDNADWEYTVTENGLNGVSARATATAVRRSGRHANDFIWLAVSANTASAVTGKYNW